MISGLKTKEVKIGENEYKIILFPAVKALKYQIKLAKLLGNFIPAIIANEGKSVSDLDLEKILIDAFTQIALIDEEKENEIHKLTIDLLSSTHVNGKSLEDMNNFNSFFSGNLIEMWKVVVEVVKANFFLKTITSN